jgi:hypothetical protein
MVDILLRAGSKFVTVTVSFIFNHRTLKEVYNEKQGGSARWRLVSSGWWSRTVAIDILFPFEHDSFV